MRSHAKSLLRRVGVELSRYPAPNTLPWQLKRILASSKVDGVIDVGAHIGEFARLLRDVVEFDGPIVSFEPSQQSYNALQRTMASDRAWSAQRCALGSASSTMELHHFASTDFNSFREPSELGRDRWTAELTMTGSESVPVYRLDEIVQLEGQLILKTDTQGHDLEVIAGASGLLARILAIVVELPIQPVYAGAPTINTALPYLTDCGFDLIGLFPLSRSADRLRVIEFDGVLVNRALRLSAGCDAGE